MAAAGDQTTLIVVMFVGIAVLGGAFYFLKKKGGGGGAMPPEGAEGAVPPDGAAAASEKFWEALPLPGTETEIGEMPGGGAGLTNINPKKVGVPITGGINFGKAGAFSPLEAGNCQCDNERCYYYQPYHTKYDFKEGYGPARKSTRILYGDKVSACERLLAEFEIESYHTRAAMGRVSRAATSPSYAYFARSRLARTGLI